MELIGITGGAGFIGSNLAKLLTSSGFRVVVIDDLSTGLLSNVENLPIDFRQVSITDSEGLKKALFDIEVVVHLAARGSVPRSVKDPIATMQVNTIGTLNVLEACRNGNKRLIFSSSSSVYGSNTALPKHEQMWLQPMSPYAASKLGAEALVSSYQSTYGIQTTLLRFFNVFGPYQRPDHEYAAVLPKWMWSALKGDAIQLHGDGKQTRDFTYVRTVCEVIKKAIEKNFSSPEVVNLAYGNNISLLDVISKLRKEFNNLEIDYLPSRIGDVKNSQNDPKRIKALFPEIHPVDFDIAFEETLSWLKLTYRNNYL